MGHVPVRELRCEAYACAFVPRVNKRTIQLKNQEGIPREREEEDWVARARESATKSESCVLKADKTLMSENTFCGNILRSSDESNRTVERSLMLEGALVNCYLIVSLIHKYKFIFKSKLELVKITKIYLMACEVAYKLNYLDTILHISPLLHPLFLPLSRYNVKITFARLQRRNLSSH